MKTLTKHLATAGVAMALLTPTFAMTGTAQAASRNGSCSSGDFCYYHGGSQTGSVSDFTGSLRDYGKSQPSCYEFKGSGSGKHLCVKNHAASVWNRSSKTVRVYFNSNYAGAHQDFKPGAKGNLNSGLRNNNASHRFLGTKPSGSSSSQSARNDYDGNARGFAQNNCTAFAAYRIASRLGVKSFSNHWGGGQWGNAGHWDNAARSAHVKVDRTPKVGAIAVNDVHKVGHVAYVNKVYSDGSFNVEEYNWNHPLGYGTRTHRRVNSGQDQFQWMLHF